MVGCVSALIVHYGRLSSPPLGARDGIHRRCVHWAERGLTRHAGRILSLNARPEIMSVSADPPEGELPYTVTLSAEATDPEGEE